MNLFNLTTTGIILSIAKAIVRGNKKLRWIFFVALFFVLVAITTAILIDNMILPKVYITLAITSAIIGGIGMLSIYAYQVSIDESEAKAEIKKVEEKIKENPNETTAAWELGRIKLESYLNRNLTQVQWIFVWTVLVMIAGFVIIGYGIIKVYTDDGNLNAGILTTITGLVIEFIGASFLLIYKSTMQQAKEYVTVLERINAVGMSVQILESISKEESKLQDQTKADLAKKLLELYGGLK